MCLYLEMLLLLWRSLEARWRRARALAGVCQRRMPRSRTVARNARVCAVRWGRGVRLCLHVVLYSHGWWWCGVQLLRLLLLRP